MIVETDEIVRFLESKFPSDNSIPFSNVCFEGANQKLLMIEGSHSLHDTEHLIEDAEVGGAFDIAEALRERYP